MSTETNSSPEKPNILLIFSDQQHWQAMGCMDPFFDTPNLDAFAEQSVVFERSFCTTPQCSPSRSTILTGFYPSRTGVMGNVGNSGGNPLRMNTIGPEWRAAGYRTGYAGKWHLGDEPEACAGWDQCDFKIDDPLAEENALRFLDSTRGKSDPFALVVSINNPHDIYRFRHHEPSGPLEDVPLSESWQGETFDGKPAVQRQFMLEDQGTAMDGDSDDAWRAYHDCYREKTRLYDEHVGRVLDALERSGHRDDTIVIITSDHGDMDTQHRLIFKGPFMYEHMIRVPLMVRVPEAFGQVSPGRIRDVDIVNTDLVPTLREFSGLPEQESHGRSFAPVVMGKGAYAPREYVIGQYYGKQKWVNPMRMIRTETHKWIRHLSGGRELYDLIRDPSELNNLADDPAYDQIASDLDAKLDQWMREHDDPFYSQQVTDRHGDPRMENE